MRRLADGRPGPRDGSSRAGRLAWPVLCSIILTPGSARTPSSAPGSALPAPPRTASWNGDPSAPPFGGVWRLAEAPAAPRGSREGWAPWPPPLKGAFATRWRKAVADAAAGTRTDDPVMNCLPPGMPRFITGDRGPLLIIQSHDRVTLYRDGMGPRRAWLDGRALPAPRDLESFYSGTTVGRYEGQDLVLDSMGFKDQPIDGTGVPHSDRLKIAERYHRVDEATLRVTVTLTDPLAYARPLTATVIYKAVDDPLWEPREFLCTPRTGYHPDLFVR
ncbi:hypothetical protein [Sphingomonas bacterium]|uniref:hypothetical protein n=1 Tax=Sphingomonas bacterium TaxID=1895847 RepID=UPI0015772465|nr:hypothetical protein [Sphingomonas bacterium]